MVLGKRERKVERILGKEVEGKERGVRSFLCCSLLFWGGVGNAEGLEKKEEIS